MTISLYSVVLKKRDFEREIFKTKYKFNRKKTVGKSEVSDNVSERVTVSLPCTEYKVFQLVVRRSSRENYHIFFEK